MAPASPPPLLEARDLVKRFPGVLALGGVGLTLGKGEVLAVIGENGAGKSTLMKILAGVQTPNSGEILLEGSPVRIDSVRTAERLGIALIHQELNLSDNLDVGANIFLGREPRRYSLIDGKTIYREAEGYLARVGLACSPRTIVSHLSVGKQQMVEIAKALSINARILIMDEPTSSLSQRETDHLFRVIRELRGKGVSVIYISHRLGEVREVADRVTVLRDGKNSGDLEKERIDHENMVRLMVGRELSQLFNRNPHRPGEVAIEARGLRTTAHPAHPVSFSVRKGEIVGLAGLVGAGRTELIETLFGARLDAGGELLVGDRRVRFTRPLDAIREGIAMVPEDRKLQGLILEMAVRENVSLPGLRRNRRAGVFLDREQERAVSREMIDRLAIKTPSDGQVVGVLSGGNQQKVALGKWLALRPGIILLDEPTRGVDIGAKHEIYRLMDELAGQGVAVLFVSSEMEEVLGMSDRVLVMHEGRISGELAKDRLSEEAVMGLATGKGSAA